MIRLAKENEISTLLNIYACAKVYMKKNGNPNQWNGTYPDADTLVHDIKNQQLYVMEDDITHNIYGCFALITGIDPTYGYIENGTWLSDSPYGTIHRIASDGTQKGVFNQCIEYSRSKFDHLRVDTHEDNAPMQKVILENDFSYRGIIYLEDGSPRLAYEWLPTLAF